MTTPVFTVFTPSYNSARTLPRVWESLKAQTFRSFEWVIIDESSRDDTAQLVENWRKQADFPLRFFIQKKPGKHNASNMAAKLAEGELFLTLDSDDACVPNALKRFLYYWRTIPEDKRAGFSAVTGLCMDQNGNPVGGRFPYDVLDSDSLDMKYRWRVKGEKWGFQRTDVMRHFPFPEVQHRALPEGVVWSAIARRYKTRYINEALRIYWIEPKAKSMTSGKFAVTGAVGYAYWHASILNNEMDWFRFAPLDFLKSAAHFSRFSFHAGDSISTQFKTLKPFARILWIIMLPFGVLAFLRDKLKQL